MPTLFASYRVAFLELDFGIAVAAEVLCRWSQVVGGWADAEVAA